MGTDTDVATPFSLLTFETFLVSISHYDTLVKPLISKWVSATIAGFSFPVANVLVKAARKQKMSQLQINNQGK